MGVTRRCESSTYVRARIYADLSSDDIGFAIVNQQRSYRTTDDFTVAGQREVVRGNMQELPAGTYYWQLPDDFKGDKVNTYLSKIFQRGIAHWHFNDFQER